MDFQQLWLEAISEEKNESDPKVPHVFSATDMSVARHGVLQPSDSSRIEDAEYLLLVCRAASHFHEIDLFDVGGIEGRDITLKFPAFEGCCQHPILSELKTPGVLEQMRDRCRSDTIMTVSFTCEVTPSGKFISTTDGIRITGTNLEEDRILCVTSERGRVRSKQDFCDMDYEGALQRLLLNSYEDIRRRQNGFRHTRCDNVSRSAVLALFKIAEAMNNTVHNLVTAIKSGVSPDEIVWKENGITITAQDLRSLDGFDHMKDCHGKLEPLVEFLLDAANREVTGARSGFPRRIRLAQEEHCIERRLNDYFKAVILNNPTGASRYAIMSATVEALIEVVGLESTLYSLCTSSLAKELCNNENFYDAMQLKSVLGLACEELKSLSLPLTGSGNKERTRRTRYLVRKACKQVAASSVPIVIREKELLHDPEILQLQYDTGNMELDLLRISDHLIQCSAYIGHDTEIRMLNLLAIGSNMIRQKLVAEEKRACFFGTTVAVTPDGGYTVESDNDIEPGFVNLKALNNHSTVFGAMLSFMDWGEMEETIEVTNPARCLPERTLFVRNTFRQFEARGLSQARAIETSVMAAKVLSIRRAVGYDKKVRADEKVIDALHKVKDCVVEKETGLDLAELVCNENEEVVEHYGTDSNMLSAASSEMLVGDGFQLLDYMSNCERYKKMDVHEDAVPFVSEGQKYYAYCWEGRVYVRKRGRREELKRRLRGNKIGLTVMGTGMQIELKKEERAFRSDAAAMDMIMHKAEAEEESKLGLWVWSKIMSGSIKYKGTGDSCMWNEDAQSADAPVQGRWSVPKWVLRNMLVMVEEVRNRERRNKILVQAGDNLPVFEIEDKLLTRYSCRQVSSEMVNRFSYRKAFFEPSMSAGGEHHPRRGGEGS